MPVNHTCLYCQHDIVLQAHDVQNDEVAFRFSDPVKYGLTGLRLVSYVCPNPNCQELAITVYWHELAEIRYENARIARDAWGERLGVWQLRPESSAKPQPDYIPSQIVEDYYESCRIRDLSPKASATLSRRCLQGMIRDFWNVKGKRNLYQEIEAIKEKVDTSTWEAIDAVRSIGNIGAHMEKDVDLIIPVEPEEAQLLIGLIETLFHEWYVVKHDREQRMGKLKRLGEKKEAARHNNASSPENES